MTSADMDEAAAAAVNAGLAAGRIDTGAHRSAPATTGGMRYGPPGAAPGRYAGEK